MFRISRPAVAFVGAVAAFVLVGCSQKTPGGQGDAAGAPSAGNAPGMPSTAGSPGDSLRSEYMNLQHQLNGLQQQAMQDSTLKAEYAQLESFVESKMAVADPQLSAHRDRLGAIQQEMAAAKQAGQNDKLQALLEEGTTIQNQLRKTQQETMALEEVKTRMDAFRDKMIAKMETINPQAKTMVDRVNAISEQLRAQAAAQSAAPPTGGATAPGATAPGAGSSGADTSAAGGN